MQVKIKDEIYIKEFKVEKDLAEFCHEFFKETGIKIMAEKETDTVEGYANKRFENGKTIIEVILYDENKAPEFEEMTDLKGNKVVTGHKSRLKKAGMNKIKKIKGMEKVNKSEAIALPFEKLFANMKQEV